LFAGEPLHVERALTVFVMLAEQPAVEVPLPVIVAHAPNVIVSRQQPLGSVVGIKLKSGLGEMSTVFVYASPLAPA
jgi:hypothetical protein